MTENTKLAKPVKLQVNHQGSWRDVMTFDVADQAEVLFNAAQLFARCKGAKLRCIIPSDTVPLMHWDYTTGWVKWKDKA